MLGVILFFAALVHAQDTIYVSRQGEQLKNFYWSMDVEHLWLRGYPIDWETGKPRREHVYYEKGHSHCSAFTAAACKRLGIYILRPPAHTAKLLANAQYDWLDSDEALQSGWRPIVDTLVAGQFLEAQRHADEGEVVVAVCQNPDLGKPGHIALVLPEKIDAAYVAHNGPVIIQAGKNNYSRTTLLEGFKNHLHGAYHQEIRFYRNIQVPRAGAVR